MGKRRYLRTPGIRVRHAAARPGDASVMAATLVASDADRDIPPHAGGRAWAGASDPRLLLAAAAGGEWPRPAPGTSAARARRGATLLGGGDWRAIPRAVRAVSRPLVLLRHPAASRPARPAAPRRGAPMAGGDVQRDVDASWDALARIAPPAGRPGPLPALPPAAGPEQGPFARAAQTQALLGLALALGGAGLAVAGQTMAPWALAGALLASGGAGAALALRSWRRGRRRGPALAGLALLWSQIGLLAWIVEMLGPRTALLACVPALAILALRMAGRAGALVAVAAPLALFAAFSLLRALGLFWPALPLGDDALALADAALLAAGPLVALAAILDLDATRRRALALAHAQRREAEDADAAYTLLRAQVSRDAERMGRALAEGLRAHEVGGVAVFTADPALHDLAETIDVATARLATLQLDREDRVRLEGAIRRTTRAVEQMTFGRGALWPTTTGTALDPLVAKLRLLDFAARRLFDPDTRLAPAAPRPARATFPDAWERGPRTPSSILPWRERAPVGPDARDEARPLGWDEWWPVDEPATLE